MPGRKFVVRELVAFGAGVAVGANWPRASNIVGFILQRLGFELTDLALWMWEPEKSALLHAQVTPVAQPKAKKRTQALLISSSHPPKRKMRAKSKKNVASSGRQSDAALSRTTRKKETNGHEAWIRPGSLNGAAAGVHERSVNSPSTESCNMGTRSTRLPTRGRQPKSAPVRSKRMVSAARRSRKTKTLPSAVLAAEAAGN
jgi:hypothetical protein